MTFFFTFVSLRSFSSFGPAGREVRGRGGGEEGEGGGGGERVLGCSEFGAHSRMSGREHSTNRECIYYICIRQTHRATTAGVCE